MCVLIAVLDFGQYTVEFTERNMWRKPGEARWVQLSESF